MERRVTRQLPFQGGKLESSFIKEEKKNLMSSWTQAYPITEQMVEYLSQSPHDYYREAIDRIDLECGDDKDWRTRAIESVYRMARDDESEEESSDEESEELFYFPDDQDFYDY